MLCKKLPSGTRTCERRVVASLITAGGKGIGSMTGPGARAAIYQFLIEDMVWASEGVRYGAFRSSHCRLGTNNSGAIRAPEYGKDVKVNTIHAFAVLIGSTAMAVFAAAANKSNSKTQENALAFFVAVESPLNLHTRTHGKSRTCTNF